MTTDDELIERLRRVFLDVVDMHNEEPLDPSRLTPDADFYEDLGIDSLMAVAMAVELQRTFRVRIPESKMGELRSLRAVAAFIRASSEAPQV